MSEAKVAEYKTEKENVTGRVINTRFVDVRVMSDVWESERQVLAFDPEKCRFEWKRSFTGDTSPTNQSPETAALAAVWLRGMRFLALTLAERAHEEAEDRELATVRKGRTVRVVAGRKVPKGTVGTCIWMGDTNYGPRVGLKTESGQVYFTAEKNVAVVGLTLAMVQAERKAQSVARENMEDALDKARDLKGEEVLVKTENGTVTGKCFWVGTTKHGQVRCGVKVTKDADPIWADVRNVELAA